MPNLCVCVFRALFWTDWDAMFPRIEGASMSGSARRVVYEDMEVGAWPNGLTLDHLERRIVWTDARWGHTHTHTMETRSIFHHLVFTQTFGVHFTSHLPWDSKKLCSVSLCLFLCLSHSCFLSLALSLSGFFLFLCPHSFFLFFLFVSCLFFSLSLRVTFFSFGSFFFFTFRISLCFTFFCTSLSSFLGLLFSFVSLLLLLLFYFCLIISFLGH